MGMGEGIVGQDDTSPAIKALANQLSLGKEAESKSQEAHMVEISKLKEMIANQAKVIDRQNIAKDLKDTNAKANASSASTKTRFAIVIDPGHSQTDATYVDIGVNGRVYRIQRGPVVEVPPEVIDILKNAVIGKAVPNIDESGLAHGVSFRKARRFPFRVLGKVVNADGERITTFEDEVDLMEV